MGIAERYEELCGLSVSEPTFTKEDPLSKESLEITTLRFPFFLANVPPSQDIINLGKTYRKPLIDLEGQFLFGELAILKYLENCWVL